MWNLLRLTFAYHRKTLLIAWCIALVFGFGSIGIWVSLIVGLVAYQSEDKERRLLLQMPLPVTRAQIGWARVAFPAAVLLLGTAIAILISVPVSALFSELFNGGKARSAELVWDQLFLSIVLIYFSQVLLTLDELLVKGGGRPRLRLTGVVLLLLLLGIALPAWVVLAVSGSYSVVALGAATLTLAQMGLTVFLFQRRRSFSVS